MALSDNDLLLAVRRYVPDDEAIGDESNRAIKAVAGALDRFSGDTALLLRERKDCPFLPRIVAASVTANPASVPGSWEPRWSEPTELEWPYLTATVGLVPKQLNVFPPGHPREGQPAVTRDIETDGSEKLRFPGVPVSAGAPALLRFTARWTVATLPDAYLEPVAVLAAALYARGMEGVWNDAAKPEPAGFDRIQTGERGARYRELADKLEALYVSMLAPATTASPHALRPFASDGAEVAASSLPPNPSA